MKKTLLISAGILGLTLAAAYPPPVVFDEQWPNWRGPDHTGMARTGAPVRWNTTENVKWKTPIPGKGHSTPIVWEDRIYLTTAVPTSPIPEAPRRELTGRPRAERGEGRPDRQRRPRVESGEGRPDPERRRRMRERFRRRMQMTLVEHKFEVLCLDKETGKILWRQTATKETPHEGYHRLYGSFASNSAVTDGRHLYAFFGSRGLFVYDLDGTLAWKKNFGVKMRMRNGFGEGTAPVLHGDILILNFDHEGQSFILALDKNTGNELWRRDRDERSTWSTPLVTEHAGKTQVIVTGDNRVRSYDIANGDLIWECGGLGTNPVPIPVRHRDTVIVMTGHRSPNMLAIRLDRTGDLTDTDAVLWTNQRGNAYTACPVYADGKLYVLTDRGLISCFDADTGQPFYHQQRLPNPYQFKASPVGSEGRLYLASEQGDVIVLKMGEEYDVVAVNSMPDHFFISSPVIVDNQLFLRSQDALYCISE